MMDRMRAAPDVVRRQRQHADNAPDPVVRRALAEEGAMPAIVLDHEQPHEKARGAARPAAGQPVAEVERRPRQRPERDQRHDRDDDLEDAAAVAGLSIADEDLGPGAGVGRNRGRRYVHVIQGNLSVGQKEAPPVSPRPRVLEPASRQRSHERPPVLCERKQR